MFEVLNESRWIVELVCGTCCSVTAHDVNFHAGDTGMLDIQFEPDTVDVIPAGGEVVAIYEYTGG